MGDWVRQCTKGDWRVSWLDLSMERLSLHISVNSVFREEHKNSSCLSVHPLQVVPLEQAVAICPCGIPRKRCNASLKQKVLKWNLLFCLPPSTTTLCWKSGTSRPLSPWNIWTNGAVSNSQCILPITSSLAERSVAGLSVSPQKSYSSKKKHAPTALFGMSRGSGTVHQVKRLPQRMA